MNELDAIFSQLRQLGLEIDGQLVYDRLTRVKVEGDKGRARSGWYVLYEFVLDNGDRVTSGAFGNWKTGIERKLDLTLPELTPEEKQAFADKQRAAKVARDEEARRIRKEAAERSQKMWDELPDSGKSPYLDRKKIRGFGLRYTRGSVVVPLQNHSALVGLQFIAPDGGKKFITGTAKRGAYHLIPSDLPGPILIVEGYATGATLHMATGLPVAIAFDAGNLSPVRRSIRSRWPDASVVFGADNDFENPENPGIAKARKAAQTGDGVLFPDASLLQEGESDWNDLHVRLDLAAVRNLVSAEALVGAVIAESAVESDDEPPAYLEEPPLCDEFPPDSSPDPQQKGGRVTLEKALQRYALSIPSAKVYDYHMCKLLTQRQAKSIIGAKVFTGWLEHENRRDVNDDVSQTEAAKAEGEGVNPYALALQRYTYLYPTDTAWDHEKREIVPLNGLRYALAGVFDQWLKSPQRKQMDKERLVFDPCNKLDPTTHINMFRGYPLTPDPDHSKSNGIRQVINSLCNNDTEVFEWLLNWLAYPLQNIGAKMATAVLMHSETQGTGKSLLFDGYIKSIYGEDYGATLGQHQLESQYTDWRSQKTFCLFEELFSRDGKYSHTGEIKHMITGATHRIEKKFISGWEEANHMNAVFLSNEVQPFPIEPSDRRMLVIWPKTKLPEDSKQLAAEQLSNGGIESLYSFLLARDLSGFNMYTEPPMNEAKRRLIQFGRPGWDIFHEDWLEGRLPVPYVPCLTRQLFKVYEHWCTENRERAMSMNKFTGFLSTRERVRRDLHYVVGPSKRSKGNFVYAGGKKPFDQNQELWLGGCASAFDKQMQGYVGGGVNA